MRFIRLEDVTFGPILDGAMRFTPGMNVFTKSAQPWSHMDPALPNFPGMPAPPGS